jgi:hypothetical protein
VKRFFLVFAVCLLFAFPSFAQQSGADAPASKEDIHRYWDTMHMQDLMKNAMDSMTKTMHQVVHQQFEKQQGLPGDFEARMQRIMDDMLENVQVEELLQATEPVYEKHLTKGDVDALVAFYSTPRGQRILKEMPAMTSEAMQAASGVTQKMMGKMMQRVQDEVAQIQKEQEGSSAKEKSSTQN